MNRDPVSCPKCRSQTVFSGAKPWCPQCGWNRDAAFRHLHQKLRGYQTAIIMGPLLIYAGARWWLEFPWPWFFLASGFWVLVGFASFLTIRKELKKFQTPSLAHGIRAKPSSGPLGGPLGGSPGGPSVQSIKRRGESSEPLEITGSTVFYQGKEIPVGWPRRVRLSRKTKVSYGWMYAVILCLEGFFAYLIYQQWEGFTPGDEMPWGILLLLALAAFVALCGWLLPRRLRKHRRLLTTGEMALGRVTAQTVRQSGDRAEHRISYHFKNKTGQVFSGEDTDQTENFHEGMVVPVVYEHGNPNRHLALCSTDYEVLPALEGG